MITQNDIFKQPLSLESMKKMQETMREAHKDDTPFTVVSRDGMAVVGDPNKTETKKRDYVVLFHFTPEEIKDRGIREEAITGWAQGQALVPMAFNDVMLAARYVPMVDAAIIKLLPYFYNINQENGAVRERTDEELVDLVNDMCIEIGDDLYNFVAAFLQIKRDIVLNMDFESVVETATQLINDFPEVFNSAESTFPDSGIRR